MHVVAVRFCLCCRREPPNAAASGLHDEIYIDFVGPTKSLGGSVAPGVAYTLPPLSWSTFSVCTVVVDFYGIHVQGARWVV